MAVDFAYKRRTRQGEGAVLRNLKLRMSRKLIYAAGMLACFSLALDGTTEEELRQVENAHRGEIGGRVEYFRRLLARPPLDILAERLLARPHLDDAARKLFSSYDRFVRALADSGERQRLETIQETERYQDKVYREVRDATRNFRDGLIDLFFDEESGLAELTRTYGVF